MSKNTKQFNISYITCPKCLGINDGGKTTCSECGGLGVGTFYNGNFLYWKQKYNRKVVKFNDVKRSINNIFNAALALAGLVGFITMAIWVSTELSRENINIDNFFFWEEKHRYIFLFWTSILFSMYSWFRYSNLKVFHVIKKIKSGPQEIPNNWKELISFDNKYKIDVANGFGKRALRTIENSFKVALKHNHREITVYHLMLSLIEDKNVLAFLKRLDVNIEKLVLKLGNQLSLIQKESKKDNYTITLNSTCKKSLIETYLRVYDRGDRQVHPMNFLLSFYIHNPTLKEIFIDLGVDDEKISNCIEWLRIETYINKQSKLHSKMSRFKPGGSMDRVYTAVSTPILDHHSKDLTRVAKWGKFDYCVNRISELEEIITNFVSNKNACVLVGESGVGKRTIIEKLAQLLAEENVPKSLKDKRLLDLNIVKLISGAKAEEIQERIMVVFDEVARAGNIILFIENINDIASLNQKESNGLDISGLLASAIIDNKVLLVSSATKENYEKLIAKTPLNRALIKINVKEPTGNFAILILESKANKLEKKYGVFYTYTALEQIIDLTSKYVKNRYLPEKAVGVMDSIGMEVLKSRGKKSLITKNDVSKLLSKLTGIPLAKLESNEREKLLNLGRLIHKNMIGQDDAVNSVSASLRRARVQLRDQNKPIASFLFLGPTGVGKTHLAKTVSKVFFGSSKNTIRLDMSKYQHINSVDKILGIKGGEEGYLTEEVRKSPFSLILLDEIEKAHPNILDLFLQVLDDGRITNANGKTLDFTNTVIIATSNIGSVFIQEQISIGTNSENIKNDLINVHLVKNLRPEMINRFSEIIVFKPLKLSEVIKIARLLIDEIEEMLNKKGILLEANEKGVEILARDGFDPIYGARPLRRVLQDRIENEIANKILQGLVKRRDTVIINSLAQIRIKKGIEL